MSKFEKELPDLTDEEVAFEMIEITCDEMNSLARAFEMINELCQELSAEIARKPPTPPEHEIH